MIKEKRLAKIKAHIDLGCGVHALAKGKTSAFIVKTGVKDLWISMTADEALSFIDKRVASLHSKTEIARHRSAEVKAHISTVIPSQFVEALHAIEASQKEAQQE